MRKKYIIIILSALPLFSQGINHSQKLVIRKSPFGLNISSEIDFRTNEEGLHHRHFDFGLRFPIGKTWLTSVQYRSVYRKNENEWSLEKRPLAQIQKTINSDKIKWSIKSRQELRIRDGRDNSMRNRFRITAKSNIRFKSIKPYIGNEFFYDFEKKSYNKNWLMVGIDLQENRYGVPSIYYKYVTDFEDNKWVPSYSLVFKITL